MNHETVLHVQTALGQHVKPMKGKGSLALTAQLQSDADD